MIFSCVDIFNEENTNQLHLRLRLEINEKKNKIKIEKEKRGKKKHILIDAVTFSDPAVIIDPRKRRVTALSTNEQKSGVVRTMGGLRDT